MSDYSRNIAEKPTKRLTNMTWKQKLIWPGAWIILAFGCFILPLTVTKIAAAVCLLIAGVGAFPFKFGPGYTYPAHFWKTIKQKMNGGLVGQTVQPALGQSRRKVLLPIPIERGGMATSAPGRKDLGHLYHPGTRRDTIIVEGEAWSGNNTDIATRFQQENSTAKALLDVLNSSYEPIPMVIGLHKGPVNIWEMRDWAAGNYHQKVLAAGRTDFDEVPPTNVYERQAAMYSEDDLACRQFTGKVRAFVALNVPRPANFDELWKKYEKKELTLRQVERKVLVTRLATSLEDHLRDEGVENVRALDSDELASFVKESHDLDLDQWYYRIAHPESPKAEPVFPDEPDYPWPLKRPRVKRDKAGRLYIDFGSSVFRIQMARRSNKRVMPGDFKPIYMTGDLGLGNETSMTVVRSGTVYSGAAESKALTPLILLADAFSASSLRGKGTYISLQEQMEEQWLKDYQDRITLSGDQQMTSNLFVSRGAINLDVLEEMDDVFDKHARQAKIELVDIPLASRQLDAWMTANLCSGLI